MSDRFGWQWEHDGDEVGQITDNGDYMDTHEIIDELNRLHNENIELKKKLHLNENILYIKEEDIPLLKEELELLRKQNKNLFKLGDLQTEINDIKTEYILTVFQEYARKYDCQSSEYLLLKDIADELGFCFDGDLCVE